MELFLQARNLRVSYTCWEMTKPIHNEPNNRSVERKINSSFFVMRGGRGWEKD